MPVAPWVPARPRRGGASVRNDDGVEMALWRSRAKLAKVAIR